MTSALEPGPFAQGIPCSCSRPPSPGARTMKTFGAPGPVANHRDLVALPHLPGGKPGSGPPPGRDFGIDSTSGRFSAITWRARTTTMRLPLITAHAGPGKFGTRRSPAGPTASSPTPRALNR